MADNRDNFPAKIVEILKKRAAFICSNPDCKKITVAPSEADVEKLLYIGRAAHISAAAKGGPRYDANMTEEQRMAIDNAIFLCSNCADMIDDNNGKDFSKELLIKWKSNHEKWVRDQLNKEIGSKPQHQVVYNISSHNQSGGITAGVVNLGKPGRHLNEQFKQQIDKEFTDPNEVVEISALMGNGEAIGFAEEIKEYLVKKGFKIKEVGQFMQAPPIKGQAIAKNRDGLRHIKIGIQE